VDSSVKVMRLVTDLDPGLIAALYRPNGTPVSDTDADVTIDVMEAFVLGDTSVGDRPIYTVTDPATGLWRVDLTRSGQSGPLNYWMSVRAGVNPEADPLRFQGFDFLGQDDGAGGYTAVDGMPVVGVAALARAIITPRPATAVFSMVDAAGTTLQTLSLTPDDSGPASAFFTGTVPVPSVPFSIVVTGTDGSGAPYRRQFSKLFRPQTVRVAFSETPVAVQAGSSTQLTAVIENLGTTAATFAVEASTSVGTVRDLSPASVVLNPGATTPATFYLDIAQGASQGIDIDLKITAWATAATTLYNTAKAHLRVAYANDRDGDDVIDSEDNCPDTPDIAQIDSDGDGIGDGCDPTPGDPVTITGFSPPAGPAGTVVAVTGTGFGVTPGENSVTIGGVLAQVTSATATQLSVTVPAGAPTGLIALVTARGNTATFENFVVESSAPGITGFSPAIGTPGTVVTIAGARFMTTANQNTAAVNVTQGSVTSSTTTELTATIATGSTSGRLTVLTPNGTAVSSEDFIVPPSPYGVADVATAARIPFATGSTVTLSTANKIGLRLFDGAPGVRVSLLGTNGITGQILGCDVMVSVLRPTGASVAAPTCMEQGGFIDTKTLGAAGTYSILVDPAGAATGSVTLTLYEVPADFGGVIVPGGPGVTRSVVTPGQNGALTFSGTAGQRVSLLGTNMVSGQVAITCDVEVSVLKPDGSVLAPATCMEASGFIDTLTLPSSGTYTIAVDPKSHAVGDVTLTLYDVPADFTSSIVPGGSVTATLGTRGQNGAITFSGTAGQRVAVMGTQGMSGQIGLTCDVNARILNPNGTVLAADACMEMSGFIDTKTLPTTGTYTIVVDPVKWAIGAVTLTLYDVPAEAMGTVTIGGSPVAVPLSQGQNGTLTFTATAGQQVTVRMTSNTIGWTTIKLLKPDGTLVTQSMAPWASFNLTTMTLATGGTYTIVVDPRDGNAGTISVAVTSP
jgi:hypothetical protein